MTPLPINPTVVPITADGEYEIATPYAPHRLVTLECYGTRGDETIQPGLVDPDDNFMPAEAAVDATKPACWEIRTGSTGRIAVKIEGAGGGTSLKFAAGEVQHGR